MIQRGWAENERMIQRGGAENERWAEYLCSVDDVCETY